MISGFIITRALLTEWQDHRRIALIKFWQRRARRLLPAVGLLLAGVLAYVAAFEPDQLAALRIDALAAMGYVTNWHLILGNQSYFDSFARPSMLRHLWSLAVEEQFYIVWPLILAFGLPILKQRGLAILIIAGIAASAIGMALLYDPTGDNSRAYFGTDTRAAGLLVGALLAFMLAGGQAQRAARWSRSMAVVGGAGPGSAGHLRVLAGRQPAVPLPGRLSDCESALGVRDLGRGSAQRVRQPAFDSSAAVGGPALLRHLPLALADLHAHMAERGDA